MSHTHYVTLHRFYVSVVAVRTKCCYLLAMSDRMTEKIYEQEDGILQEPSLCKALLSMVSLNNPVSSGEGLCNHRLLSQTGRG